MLHAWEKHAFVSLKQDERADWKKYSEFVVLCCFFFLKKCCLKGIKVHASKVHVMNSFSSFLAIRRNNFFVNSFFMTKWIRLFVDLGFADRSVDCSQKRTKLNKVEWDVMSKSDLSDVLHQTILVQMVNKWSCSKKILFLFVSRQKVQTKHFTHPFLYNNKRTHNAFFAEHLR